MKDLIFFNHIPKTAGSSFLNVLFNQYTKNEIFHLDAMNIVSSIEQFKSLPKSHKNQLNCISGHLSFLLENEIERPFLKITMLREPVDTFVSNFYYIKRATWNRNHNDVKNMNSIVDFAEYCIQHNMTNQQTRYLAEDVDYLLKNEYPEFKVDKNTLDKALKNLDNHDFVFLSEEFDKALLFLKNKLKWKSTPYYKIANKTSNRISVTDLSELELKTINQCIHYDLILYDAALLKFEKMLIDQPDEFAKYLKRFQIINKLRNVIRR
jgi:hypothetical protein